MRNGYFALVNAVLLVALFAPSGFAQSLNFGNNFFVTGDYVVGGVGLRGLGDSTGYATGTITIPDANPGISGATSVPAGAQIVAALLYWETIEGSKKAFVGQQGFFRPVFAGGPSSGYPITGVVLGDPNAPVSWGLGGCSGLLPRSQTLRAYRADVRAFLPQDPNGNVLANGSYEVRLADGGSKYADDDDDTPQTLGATLVIIYRVLSPAFPLNAVVIYDGALAPSLPWSIITQRLQGFYQAAATPVTKLTHIVGNGKPYKYEGVFLNKTFLPSLYGKLPSFPGYYKGAWGQGAWDNPTWSLAAGGPVNADDATATTSIVPLGLTGCVSYGAVILGTTVQNSDGDGILDVWKQNQGYTDVGTGQWVDLSADGGAAPNQQDIFIQLDYMVNANGSFLPSPNALTMVKNAFVANNHNVHLHIVQGNAIQEQTCTDNTNTSPPQLCAYPNQPGVVSWKGGLVFLKTQPTNYPDEASCEAATRPACTRRFNPALKDSYHYMLFGDTLGAPNWNFVSGTLTNNTGSSPATVVQSGNTVTFYTSTAHGLVVSSTLGNGRVTIVDAITNPNLNGTYLVASTSCPNSNCSFSNRAPGPYAFTIVIGGNSTSTTYTMATDPNLSVASGLAGTGSGMSDVGGTDSLITLGRWGTQPDSVWAGTAMHELGHSLGLTHGGFFFDKLSANPNNYLPTIEDNCKSNFQSVMNYFFQVDLLDTGTVDQNGNPVMKVDYSEQDLSTLSEGTATPAGFLSGTFYPTTDWYAPTSLVGGTPAKLHCDGTPILDGAQYSRVPGLSSSLSWLAGQDINFDGKIESAAASPPPYGLRGYNDWANIDLRQVGATGSLSVAGGAGFLNGGAGFLNGGAGFLNGGAGFLNGGAGFLNGGAGFLNGGAGFLNGGLGRGEITFEVANSVTRPPRSLKAAPTPPRYIQLTWNDPSFGQIALYNVYRSVNGEAMIIASVPATMPPITYVDKNVICGTNYTYFVTAILAGTSPPQESSPSNSVSLTGPCYTFTGFLPPLATAGDSSYSGAFEDDVIPIKWQIQDISGNYVTDLTVNTLKEYFTPLPKNKVCPLPSTAPGNYKLIPLYSPAAGVAPSKVKPKNTFTSNSNQFIFNWNSEDYPLGCYIIELDLQDGQVKRTSLRLYER